MTPIVKAIGTAFTDWWNWSDGEPSYQDAFKAGYEAALRAQPDHIPEAGKMVAQPVAQPLTVQEVEQILHQHNYELHGDRARYIVRMTERAHGIGAKK